MCITQDLPALSSLMVVSNFTSNVWGQESSAAHENAHPVSHSSLVGCRGKLCMASVQSCTVSRKRGRVVCRMRLGLDLLVHTCQDNCEAKKTTLRTSDKKGIIRRRSCRSRSLDTQVSSPPTRCFSSMQRV